MCKNLVGSKAWKLNGRKDNVIFTLIGYPFLNEHDECPTFILYDALSDGCLPFKLYYYFFNERAHLLGGTQKQK